MQREKQRQHAQLQGLQEMRLLQLCEKTHVRAGLLSERLLRQAAPLPLPMQRASVRAQNCSTTQALLRHWRRRREALQRQAEETGEAVARAELVPCPCRRSHPCLYHQRRPCQMPRQIRARNGSCCHCGNGRRWRRTGSTKRREFAYIQGAGQI